MCELMMESLWRQLLKYIYIIYNPEVWIRSYMTIISKLTSFWSILLSILYDSARLIYIELLLIASMNDCDCWLIDFFLSTVIKFIRYKKFTEAKSLSNKTEEEKRAIFGALKSPQSGSKFSTAPALETSAHKVESTASTSASSDGKKRKREESNNSDREDLPAPHDKKNKKKSSKEKRKESKKSKKND